MIPVTPNPIELVLLGLRYSLVIPVHVWPSVCAQFQAYPYVSLTGPELLSRTTYWEGRQTNRP